MSLYCKPVSRPCSPTSPTRTLSDTDIHDDLLDPHDFLHPLFSEFNPLDASPMYQHDIPSPYSSSLSAHDSSSSAASPSPKSQFEPLTTKAYALSNNHDNTKTASLADNYLFLTDYLVPETDNILLTDRPPSRRMEDTLDRPLQIRVLGVPNTGAKSRVETQIKLCIQLLTAKGTKVSCWSYLKLPEELLAKSRLRKNQQQQRVLDGSVASMISDESKVLSLEARVVCASDPDKTIRMCAGCVRRERKRAERTKDGKPRKDSRSPTGSETELSKTAEEEMEMDMNRILLFNCGPMVNFSSGDVILPTRITCYCRHHNEKIGFCVQFVMKNNKGEAIASGVSPPIMITDDHKNTKQRSAGRKRPRSDDYEVSTPADSRRGSVSPKQTKQEQPVNTLSIAEAAELASMLPTPSEENAPTLFAPMASSTSTPTVNPPLNEIFQRAIQSDEPLPQLFATESENTEIWPFNRRRRTTRTFPTGISGVSGLPIELPPQLERLVPSQGPTYGGVEVTVLGSGFYRGLTCLFGEHPATTVYWNPNTLVCVLPPAAHPGPVVVSFKEHPLVIEGQDVALFTYYDASDQALLELALQVVGLKMTGKLHDAKHIAMRIVQGDQQPSSSSNQHQSSSSQHQYSMDIEQQVMKALETLDAPDIVHANPSGHTLLHLAVMLDYRDLVQALVAKIRPEELDHPDRNGFTALHFACWRGSHLLTKILLKAGANPEATCSLGTALEVAKSNNVIKMLASCTVKPSPSRRPSIKAQYMRRFHSLQETEAVEDDLSMDQNGLGLAIPKSDRRLYMFWVPLLLVTVGLLYFQILGNRTFLTVLWDRIPLRNFGSRIAV